VRASVKQATKFTPCYFHLVQAVVSSAASTTKEQAYEALPDKKIVITSAEQLDGRGAAVLALPPLPCRCCPLHGIGDNAPDLLGVVSREALLGIRGVDRGSRDERPDERGEKGLSPPARVVDDLEEGEIGGQLLLRDAAVRPEPGAQ
jgi:hypothetical protein